jgi:hypothetical protein
MKNFSSLSSRRES